MIGGAPPPSGGGVSRGGVQLAYSLRWRAPFFERKSFREDKGENPGNTLDLPEKYLKHKKDIIMKKGDMLILHGNCAHGSYPNKSSTRSRPLYSITYIKKGEKFLVGKNANRKEFSLH